MTIAKNKLINKRASAMLRSKALEVTVGDDYIEVGNKYGNVSERINGSHTCAVDIESKVSQLITMIADEVNFSKQLISVNLHFESFASAIEHNSTDANADLCKLDAEINAFLFKAFYKRFHFYPILGTSMFNYDAEAFCVNVSLSSLDALSKMSEKRKDVFYEKVRNLAQQLIEKGLFPALTLNEKFALVSDIRCHKEWPTVLIIALIGVLFSELDGVVVESVNLTQAHDLDVFEVSVGLS